MERSIPLMLKDKTEQREDDAVLAQARWLIEHELRIGDTAGGWPILYQGMSGPVRCLSATVQGQAISVLARAYALTSDEEMLDAARRAVRTCELDILDGGVSTPVAGDGLFFEEEAVYPAAHTLNGVIFALLGLYDYLNLIDDANVTALIQRGHDSLHRLLPEFDAGYWTRADLLHRGLASVSQHEQQTCLLQILASCTRCNYCAAFSRRWERYQQRVIPRLHAKIARHCSSVIRKLWHPVQKLLFKQSSSIQVQEPLRVCMPITAFPVTGGMRTVVASIAHVTRDIWDIEYLTQYSGQNPEKLHIHRFSMPASAPWLMAPWQFPAVWLYVLAGGRKLIALLRRKSDFALILPQDGVYTAAFAACVARLASIRVVCMDYGNLTLLGNPAYQAERLKAVATKNRLYKLVGPVLLKCYWPSLTFFTWLSTRLVDHFLISGLEGDGIEDIYCNKLGVPRSRITRYAYMIDIDRHPIFDACERASKREQYGIPSDALVITMICRLAPEKGVDVALESISLVLARITPEQRARTRFVLAGDGPLRQQIEEEINARRLRQVCKLWGEASSEDVVTLLGLCDIFLHTSIRGAFYSMNVLEAMASGCAIVASNEPPLNEQLLADGRGVVVPAGDAQRTAQALVSLIDDAQRCRQMGASARSYIERHHSPTALKRVLLRATSWANLDEILNAQLEGEGTIAATNESER